MTRSSGGRGSSPALPSPAASPGEKTATLDDGKVYSVTGAIDLKKVKVGDKVKLTYMPTTLLWQSTFGIVGSAHALAPAT